MDAKVWERAGTPTLTDDAVHVWRVCVSQTADMVAAVEPTLSQEELERAQRYRFPNGRLIYTLGRGLLRVLLGHYLNRIPGELRFTTNAHGKPALATTSSADDLQFNLSHSGDWVVYALAWHRAVGIDVEQHRPLTTLADIAKRFFSPGEVAQLFGLPESQRAEAFFRCWARKEAYIKAVGRGLTLGLDQFDVSLLPEEPARLVAARGEAAVPGPWHLEELEVAPDYAGAVAVQGWTGRLCCWEGPPHWFAVRGT